MAIDAFLACASASPPPACHSAPVEPGQNPCSCTMDAMLVSTFPACCAGGCCQRDTHGSCAVHAQHLTCRVDAGKVELDGAQYLGFKLPFTVSQLTVIEAILVGGAEIYRNGARGLENRIYPGAHWVSL